jgi:uncharacterized protein (TIGR02611 family)
VKDPVRLLRRIAVTVVGTVILVVGLVLLVAPGPGLVVIALALAVFAIEYQWARRNLAAVQERARSAALKAAASHVATASAVLFGIGAIGFAPYRLTLTRCTVVSAAFGSSGSFCRATRLPPTRVCSLRRLSICCSSASIVIPCSWSTIRSSSSSVIGFSGCSGTPASLPDASPARERRTDLRRQAPMAGSRLLGQTAAPRRRPYRAAGHNGRGQRRL